MKVLISGAGIAGPTLAWWLSRIGAEVTLVDISESFLAQGQNIDLTGAAITIVKRMGIEGRIKELNTTEKGTRIVDRDGRVLASFDVAEGGLSPTSPYEILRGDLALLLAGATRDDPNVKYIFHSTVKEVISNDEHGVKVELSNGEVREFDLLVAADGQWSHVRRKCFDPSTVTVVDKNMYAAYYTVPRTKTDTDYWRIYWPLKRRVVSARPDPYGTTRAALTKMPTTEEQKKAWESVSREGSREDQISLLKSEYADVGGDAARFLKDADTAQDFYMQGIKQIRMTKWSKGRIICLGDAAYAPTPLTGMGTSLAIIGAYVLSGELSKLDKGEHPRKAFDAYEKTFRPFVEKTQHIPSIAPGIVHPVSEWQRWLLQSALWFVAKVLSVPFVARLVAGGGDPEADDGGFPMPVFPTLEKCLKGS